MGGQVEWNRRCICELGHLMGCGRCCPRGGGVGEVVSEWDFVSVKGEGVDGV